MNLNKKIQKFSGDGIPEYNKRINELVDVANWLLGVRTINGKPIAESDQGPIIDLSQVNATQNPSGGASAIDPDGNQAGWRKITLIDTVAGNFFDIWAWSGANAMNIRPVPWLTDNNTIQAGWLTGAQGELWGTGSYPIGGAAKYQQVKFTKTTSDSSPTVWTGSLVNIPIIPPPSAPVLFLRASPNLSDPANQSTYPVTPIWLPSIGGPAPGITITFNWKITYDGTEIFNVSGSGNFTSPKIYVPLSKTGWTFDPVGLSGYTHGDNAWIYLYNGPISSNTNPPIIETFTYTLSVSGTVELNIFGATLFTG